MHGSLAWDGSAPFGGLCLTRAGDVAAGANLPSICGHRRWTCIAGLGWTGCHALMRRWSTDDSWLCEYAPRELKRLVQILSGADHYRRMRLNPAAIELAVTMPLVPSHLEKELASKVISPCS